MPDQSDEIRYRESVCGLEPEQLAGFHVGWPRKPSPVDFLASLRGSSHVVLAIDSNDRVIGVAAAISDGVLFAYVSHLEVLPGHQGFGIGTELMQRLLRQLGEFYAIDLSCDEEVVPFYRRLELTAGTAMMLRRRELIPTDV